jgi:hypothetical protein
MDPEVARQHAHAAATLAFARAQQRSSADAGHGGGGLSRSNTVNHHDRQPLTQQANNNGDGGIKRQQSVRFVGSKAIERRQSIGSRPPVKKQASTAILRPIAIITDTHVPAAYRPPSRSSSRGKASFGKNSKERLALADYDDYYTNEDDVASTPSSYRRIRRSKSMFSPLKAPNVFYTNGTPESSNVGHQTAFSNSQTPHSQPPQMPLRAPKSMSFLRGRRDHMRAALRERNDVAVQMARDRFFHQATQQRLREQPSFLFRSKAQRQEKPFRKSVRSRNANSYGPPVASADQEQPQKDSSLKEAARKASKTIRKKLKRAFGRSKYEPVAIPDQQVEAQTTHVREHVGDSSIIPETISSIPHPDEASLSRVASRVPSLHAANSNQQLGSHAGSIKSFRSGHSDDTSRVTSWNSTAVNTVTSQTARTQAERDQQRLSIINENGTHVSSSFNQPRVPSQFAANQRPSKNTGYVPMPGPNIDSARLASALMKRLDENSPKALLEASRKASLESIAISKQAPPRSSSVDRCPPVNRSPATIRTTRPLPPTEDGSENGSKGREIDNHEHIWVTADSVHSARAEDVFGNTGSHVHQWVAADSLREKRMRRDGDNFLSMGDGMVGKPRESLSNKEHIPVEPTRGSNGSNHSPTAHRQASTKSSYYTVPESTGLTPQEIALRNESVIHGAKVLRESRSTFFGGSTFTMSRAQSPFRRALAESDYNSNVAATKKRGSVAHLSGAPSLQPNPLFLAPERAASLSLGAQETPEGEKAYSESVYSRTTSGQTPIAATSALSLLIDGEAVPKLQETSPGTGEGVGMGDAVIIEAKTYRPAMPANRTHRATSSPSSTDLKMWMSSEVAKLEKAREHNHSKEYVNYALPSMPRSFHNGPSNAGWGNVEMGNGGQVGVSRESLGSGRFRESAQIGEDDTDVAQLKVHAIKQLVGMVQMGMQMQSSNVLQNPTTRNPPLLKPILKKTSQVLLLENIGTTNSTPAIPIPPPLPPPPPPVPPRSPQRSPLRHKPSTASLRSVNMVGKAAPNSPIKVSSLSSRNLLHKRNTSNGTLRSVKSSRSLGSVKSTAETPAKLVKKRGPNVGQRSGTPTPMSKPVDNAEVGERTPGLSVVVKNRPESRGNEGEGKRDVYGAERAGLMGPGVRPSMDAAMEMDTSSPKKLDAQVMGSKRMVDLFLSSRRRRIGGSEESGAVFL